MADKTLEMTMLYDFYGDMLTDKQREYFDLYYNDDLSLSEIADSAGISRQGVHDIIARAENTMLEMENKLGVIARYNEVRNYVAQIKELAEAIASDGSTGVSADNAREILSIINTMKGQTDDGI